MKLIATIPVRNEAWVVGLSARVALMWCDEIVILNHASCDRTVDLLGELQREHSGRVHVVSVPEAAWSEMQHREYMLELARAKGATHIAIVDADEILTGNLLGTAMSAVSSPGRGQILQLPGYNMRSEIDRFHINGIWGQRWFSTAFKDDERLHWSAHERRGEDHHQREPMGMQLMGYRPVAQGAGGVMHLWGVTERRLIARHAWYKIMEAIKYPAKPRGEIETMYSWAVRGRPGVRGDTPDAWTYQKAPESWWAPYAHLMRYLDLDAVPWQEAEAQRLYTANNPELFKGLDLFGVV